MANAPTPTKANLLAIKKSLEFSQNGYDLLDRKRTILLRETSEFMGKAQGIRQQLAEALQQAYTALKLANLTLPSVEEFAKAVPLDTSLTLRGKSVMGVEIPMLSLPQTQGENYYGFAASNSYLDKAFFEFQRAKKLAVELAQVENSVYRLTNATHKTAKRANALKNIVIPQYKEQIARINEVLEERDLEEHSRMKVIKNQKQK